MAHTQKSALEETTIKSFNGRDSNSPAPTFKFNAQAPEFVPRSHTKTTTTAEFSGYFYPFFHHLGGGSGVDSQSSDWIFFGDGSQHHLHDPTAAFFISNPAVQFPLSPNHSSPSNISLSDDLRRKIVKQVEYQFTDISLLANESISKYMNKDPEGYVPISYIASAKKIKAITSNQHLVSMALRSSWKLVVSEDGRKVKRRNPFTEKEREDLQSRTVVAENLPDDHSYQNLEKIFGAVGIVKAIRICHPQEFNSSRPKGEYLMSNKIHALIEYDDTDTAESAVEKLSDERDWRKGLRVRLLLRCSPKSVLKNRRMEFDGILDDDDIPTYESGEESSHHNAAESLIDNDDDHTGGGKKGWGKGRGKGRSRIVTSYGGNGRGLGPMSPLANSNDSSSPKLGTSRGPKMPDGTRGFAFGRGKHSSIPSAPIP